MSEQSVHTAEHIESLRVGSLSVGGTTVVRQMLQCEFLAQGVQSKRSAILSTPLSIVDPVTNAKTPFQVPTNARIVGITVLPIADQTKLCPVRKNSALCMGFARCRRNNTDYGYTGALYVPTYGELETQPVKEAKVDAATKVQVVTYSEGRSIQVDLTNIDPAWPLASFDFKPSKVAGLTECYPNAYHGLFRYLSPARMPATALANRSVGVTYENADVLLTSKRPQYFEWNSTAAAAEDPNVFLQMHVSVWSFGRVPKSTPPAVTDVYGGPASDTAADYYISDLAEKVEVRVELVYELQSDALDDRERAYAH